MSAEWSDSPTIVVLGGGTSAEREVSLGSGAACAVALARSWPTRLIDVREDGAPTGIDPAREVVFSTLHGTFGEDGGMQRALDAAGIVYAGCDAVSSELTFDKQHTKQVAAEAGVPGPRGVVFDGTAKPAVDDLVGGLGPAMVFKPNRSGSSVGLQLCDGAAQITAALATITTGEWIAEAKVAGRELTVGVLDGRALAVVEIVPDSGVFDYASKYTKGLTKYLAPAPLREELAAEVRRLAEVAYAACGCRDYARVDFMLASDEQPRLLEINTLPGMKETSLLPMSAQCMGMDFTALVRAMVTPAVARFAARQTSVSAA